ncbi:MAG: hypothetical protein NZL87_05920, partial [Thermomicrobium sp.]|nr:hypothetical protein [Thermomicrobium sp.]
MPGLAHPGADGGLSASPPSPYHGGEALLDALGAIGVEVVFAASGSEWAPVWEALARRDRD